MKKLALQTLLLSSFFLSVHSFADLGTIQINKASHFTEEQVEMGIRVQVGQDSESCSSFHLDEANPSPTECSSLAPHSFGIAKFNKDNQSYTDGMLPFYYWYPRADYRGQGVNGDADGLVFLKEPSEDPSAGDKNNKNDIYFAAEQLGVLPYINSTVDDLKEAGYLLLNVRDLRLSDINTETATGEFCYNAQFRVVWGFLKTLSFCGTASYQEDLDIFDFQILSVNKIERGPILAPMAQIALGLLFTRTDEDSILRNNINRENMKSLLTNGKQILEKD